MMARTPSSSSANKLYYLFILALLCFFHTKAHARLIRAAILPHGDVAWDPSVLPDNDAAAAIAAAAHATGYWLGSSSSDLVILSTPHGLALPNDFGLSLGQTAAGSVEIGQDEANSKNNDVLPYTATLPPVRLTSELLVQDVLSSLDPSENVTTIQVPDGAVFPLYWAEVIPLLLVGERTRSASPILSSWLRRSNTQRSRADTSTTNPALPIREHLIWTHPTRRYTNARAMIPELLRLGRSLTRWLDHAPIVADRNVTVIVSGDLSHTHRADGPYGASTVAVQTDAALGQWASDPCRNADDLLVQAAHWNDEALVCGLTGFVWLHGMLCPDTTHDDGNKMKDVRAFTNNHRVDRMIDEGWEARVRVNRNATYFGMMVAEFERRY